MKVAFFTETFLPKVDGIVTRLTKTVKHLVDAGDEVVVFCPEGAPSSYMGSQVIGVPAMPLPLYPELKLALPRPAVSEAIDAFQPDLIHVVNPAVLGGGIWLAKTKDIPLVASYHTHRPNISSTTAWGCSSRCSGNCSKPPTTRPCSTSAPPRQWFRN